MARRARVVIEGGVYHVYNRVGSGERVFDDSEEAARFVDLMREVKQRDGWTVFAWCLMANHYHLAVRTSAVPLSHGMHHLQCTFSRGFNRRHGRTGSLWQSRYQARLVDEERYLAQVVVYVHLNPVRAGIVEDPANHELGGHWEIVKRVKAPLVDVHDTLLCFGETTRSARRSYLSAMRAGCDSTGDGIAEVKSLRSLSWHDEELEPKPGQEHVDVLGRSTGLERPVMPAAEFVEQVCRLLGTEPERLASRARDSATAEMRRVVATLGVERWGQKGRDIAGVLNKNPDVVSWWVGQGARRRLEDREYAQRLDDLDRALAEGARTVGQITGKRHVGDEL